MTCVPSPSSHLTTQCGQPVHTHCARRDGWARASRSDQSKVQTSMCGHSRGTGFVCVPARSVRRGLARVWVLLRAHASVHVSDSVCMLSLEVTIKRQATSVGSRQGEKPPSAAQPLVLSEFYPMRLSCLLYRTHTTRTQQSSEAWLLHEAHRSAELTGRPRLRTERRPTLSPWAIGVCPVGQACARTAGPSGLRSRSGYLSCPETVQTHCLIRGVCPIRTASSYTKFTPVNELLAHRKVE